MARALLVRSCMLSALTLSLVLGCWDEERLDVPWRSVALECHEECDVWSVERAERLAGRRLWVAQVFAGSEAGAWRALEHLDSPIGAYWQQGHPGRATQGTVERSGATFRAIAAVFATREAAQHAYPHAWVRRRAP